MSRLFSLAYLTIPGTDPVSQIKIAAEAGYDRVSLRTIPMFLPGEPIFQMEKDPALFRDVKSALQDANMKLLDIELARVREDLDISTYEAAFEKGAELGATDVISSIWSTDRDFYLKQFETICDMAAKYSLNVNLEFVCLAPVSTLAAVLDVIDTVARPNARVMTDTFHAYRAGVSPKEIAAAPKEKFGLIHLCDAPAEALSVDVSNLAPIVREGRLYVGEGAVDIAEYIRALPATSPISIELPNAKESEARGMAGHAARCLETAKKYFAENGLN